MGLCEVIAGRLKDSMACPRHETDRRLCLRVGGLSDRVHGGVQSLTPLVDGCFALPAELPDATLALSIPADIASASAACATSTAGVARDAHASATSAISVLVNWLPF
jgi:hypothetical protein